MPRGQRWLETAAYSLMTEVYSYPSGSSRPRHGPGRESQIPGKPMVPTLRFTATRSWGSSLCLAAGRRPGWVAPGQTGEHGGSRVTGYGGPVWVGLLDLDGDEPVTAVIGPLRADHQQARILVRMHRAPIGMVRVPTPPAQTLTERARAAAESELAGPLRRHAELDQEPGGQDGSGGDDPWERRITCPGRFAGGSGEGISVLVCTRNRPTLLADSLRSLMRIDYDPMEIVVVDNAPDGDATREIVTELAADDPRVRYTCQPRPGKSVALNHGFEQVKFELVAITDDDTLVDPGWLAAVAAAFEADPDTVCVTGMVAASALDTRAEQYFDSRYDWGTRFHPLRFDLIEHRYPSPFYPFTPGFGIGANCAVRCRALARIGGFDPLLGAGTPRRSGADSDAFARLILAGGRLSYLPSALIWHRHRTDSRALARQLYDYGHGFGAYVAKHLPNREMRKIFTRDGAHHVSMGIGRQIGRQQQAVQSSEFGMRGLGLALVEVSGMVPGALRYWLAARRSPESSPGPR
jgi:GT2 family glycosyltransferase